MTKANAGSSMVAPGNCASDNNRCIYGKYCTSSGDTCSGTCFPGCMKCTGPAKNNCTRCSPFSKIGDNSPNSGDCQESN